MSSPAVSAHGQSLFSGHLPLKQGVYYSRSRDKAWLIPSGTYSQHGNEIDGLVFSPVPFALPKSKIGLRSIPWSHASMPIPAGLFFAVPNEVVDSLCKISRGSLSESSEIQTLKVISRHLQDTTADVGYFNQRVISFEYLDERIAMNAEWLRISARQVCNGDVDSSQIDEILRQDERLMDFFRYTRAYCGWLSTNDEFVRELSALYENFRPTVDHQGFPTAQALNRITYDSQDHFQRECSEFYDRWMLEGIAGCDLPRPVQFCYIEDRPPSLRNDQPVRLRMVYPSHLPAHGKGHFVEMHAASRPRMRLPHLRGWFDLIEEENAGKNKIEGYIRRFRCLIYLRGIHAACGREIKFTRAAMIRTFAAYFECSEDTIKNDLRRLDPILPLYEKGNPLVEESSSEIE